MTRYFCTDRTHRRNGRTRAIDVTPQVRVELGFMPRQSAYLASTSDVVRRALHAPTDDLVQRDGEMRRILTGTTAPLDAPVVLVSDLPEGRSPGLYELEDLRRSGGEISEVIGGSRTGSSQMIVLPDEGSSTEPATRAGTSVPAPPGSFAPTAEGERTIATQAPAGTVTKAVALPQGTYGVLELARNLADAPADEGAIVETLRATPPYEETLRDHVGEPWRVVVECPEPEGDPPVHHRVVFAGSGDPEPLDVFGAPAAGWDVVLEEAAEEDLAPPVATYRAERLLKAALVGELIVTAALIAITWASGALGYAARQTPGWLAIAAALGIGGFAVGLITLYAPRDADGNANNTLVVGLHYRSRVQMLWMGTSICVGLFALALAAAIVPPIVLAHQPLPAPSIAFQARNPVTATVQLSATNIGTDQVVSVEIRQYATAGGPGTLIGRVNANGDQDGHLNVNETIALNANAQFLSVAVAIDGSPQACSPDAPIGEGCTVVAVPPLGAPVSQFAPVASPSVPSPASPSPVSSPVSISPTVTTSPFSTVPTSAPTSP
jgi:hypothetical protein